IVVASVEDVVAIVVASVEDAVAIVVASVEDAVAIVVASVEDAVAIVVASVEDAVATAVGVKFEFLFAASGWNVKGGYQMWGGGSTMFCSLACPPCWEK
ncbi:hypothetical protein TcCL_NonESM01043, partial [Trypanosoma cruzi]